MSETNNGDAFKQLISWMSETDRRLNVLESENRRLTAFTHLQQEYIKSLQEFRSSVRLIVGKSEVSE